jgi:tRNA 2-thiouridine synthesizing protein A
MSENEKYANKTIDLRGLHGLEVELRTKIEIDRLPIGGRLRVLCDPESEEGISRFVTRNGHELISTSGLDFLIRKN